MCIRDSDQTKDQSYFLWKLPQEILQLFLFPLGTYTKQEVREYLRQKGVEAKARGGESMEICFIEGEMCIRDSPDDVTVANFQVQVHYVTLKGEVKSEYIPFKVGKSCLLYTSLFVSLSRVEFGVQSLFIFFRGAALRLFFP